MKRIATLVFTFSFLFGLSVLAQDIPISEPKGYRLVWHDEFDQEGHLDTTKWGFENGFVRNRELQYYTPENARQEGGILIITGKREEIVNVQFDPQSKDWRKNQKVAEYSSASLNTKNKFDFQYGILEVRVMIDTASGMWPAIWTLGVEKPWPANGEIDVMEFYQVEGEPTILANAAWADESKRANWDEAKIPFDRFLEKDPEWMNRFHIWKMEWTAQHIKLYLDGELLNEVDLSQTLNPDGFNPFHQPHYILVNLAIGSNGGDPSPSTFPRNYLIDYVRVFQPED